MWTRQLLVQWLEPTFQCRGLGFHPLLGTKILPATWKLHVGLIAVWHVGWAYIPCIGRWVLNHWTLEKPLNSWVFGEESSVAPLIRKSTSALSASRSFIHSYWFLTIVKWAGAAHLKLLRIYVCIHTHTHTHTQLRYSNWFTWYRGWGFRICLQAGEPGKLTVWFSLSPRPENWVRRGLECWCLRTEDWPPNSSRGQILSFSIFCSIQAFDGLDEASLHGGRTSSFFSLPV